MKIALLTTETLHHAYFARELARNHAISAFCETRPTTPPPFATHHTFEDAREEHEVARWFNGVKARIGDFVPSRAVETMNDPAALIALQNENPDAVIVFGTGMLKLPLCEAFEGRIFNLHGADPEQYRGLDSHLWAIYHRDFAGLVTTLHRLDAGLDTGDIVGMKPLPLARHMKLHRLRAVNSELCVRLTQDALTRLDSGTLTARPQASAGRYYSAMPTVLKDICVRRFEAYTARMT